MRVEPPTMTMWLIFSMGIPASLIACWNGRLVRSRRSSGKEIPEAFRTGLLETLPTGGVWPIPSGADSLVEIAFCAGSLEALIADESPRDIGPWSVGLAEVRSFPDDRAACRELRKIVRIWRESQQFLSSQRCLMVLPDSSGSVWRIWQAVESLPSLLAFATEFSQSEDPRRAIYRWLHLGAALEAASESFPKAHLELTWGRKSLTIENSLPVFRGLIPDPEAGVSPTDSEQEVALLVDESLEKTGFTSQKLLETLRSLRLGNPLLVSVARTLDDCLARIAGHGSRSQSETVEIR